MPPLRLRSRRLAAATLALLLLAPVAGFLTASLLKYTLGFAALYDAMGFLADPQRLPWYDRLSPVLFVGGPLAALALSLSPILRLELRREAGQLVTTVRLTPNPAHIAIASLSVALLGLLAGYVVLENLASVVPGA